MTSKMMQEKWTFAFVLMDVNKDGILSQADKEQVKQYFKLSYQPSGEEETQMMSELDAFWEKAVFLTSEPDWTQTFTPEQFIKYRDAVFPKDPKATRTKIFEAMMHILHASDVNKAGCFTFEEFKTLHAAFNIKDDRLLHGLFQLVGSDSERKCPLHNVAEFYAELTMGSDENKHSEYMAAMAAAGFLPSK